MNTIEAVEKIVAEFESKYPTGFHYEGAPSTTNGRLVPTAELSNWLRTKLQTLLTQHDEELVEKVKENGVFLCCYDNHGNVIHNPVPQIISLIQVNK